MDAETVRVYEERAQEFAAAYRVLEPKRLRAVIRGFFRPGEPTVDVGSGSGRDVSWLNSEGFPTVGFDPAAGMLTQAQAAYPGCDFRSAGLPDLAGVGTEQFGNVLCSAVLMHLRREDLITAVLSLARITRPGGRLVLTLRPPRDRSEREPDGRLFTRIHSGKLTLLLESAGFLVQSSEQQSDVFRPEVTWTVLLAEKSTVPATRGLDRIQGILADDAKFATYKLALVRALCTISRTERELVRWGDDAVYVPLWLVAVHWLEYYWPLVNAPQFVAQQRGEQVEGTKRIKFRRVLGELAERMGRDGLWAVRRQLDQNPQEFAAPLKLIAETIRKGPVTHAGSRISPVFDYKAPDRREEDPVQSLGWVQVPQAVWLDISRFEHWIEDSVVIRWARLTAEMNPGATVSDFVPLLLPRVGDERDTQEVRGLLARWPQPLECVWSGQSIRRGSLQVDHAIPYSVWGNNDLWNLLPCLDQVNGQKGNAVPSPRFLAERRGAIYRCWSFYREELGARFDFQISRALGCPPGTVGWEDTALAGLQETVQKLAMTRGLRQWDGP